MADVNRRLGALEEAALEAIVQERMEQEVSFILEALEKRLEPGVFRQVMAAVVDEAAARGLLEAERPR